MTTEAGIKAAYATEINSCTFREDAGTRLRSRPQSFCASVEMTSTLDVAGASTFALPITVEGVPYTPTLFTANGVSTSILSSKGLPIVIAAAPSPIPPSPTFSGITVTGAAVFNNVSISGTAEGVFDAGAY